MKNKPLFYNTALSTLLLVLSGISLFSCSNYRFNSNLDQQPIKDYFAVGDVEIYSDADLVERNYQYLDTVEGESCQKDQTQLPANDSDARTHARQQAAKLKANGIIFSPCFSLDNPESECLSTRICSGKAIKIAEVSNENNQ